MSPNGPVRCVAAEHPVLEVKPTCQSRDAMAAARRISAFRGAVTLARPINANNARAMRAATGLAEHLNMMHQARRGHRSITLRNIDDR